MSNKISIADLPTFDVAEHLKNEDDIAAYLALVLEDGDPALLAATLGDIARARNMTQLARSPMDSRKRSTKRIRWRAGDGTACSK